jgi:hypothetical protein
MARIIQGALLALLPGPDSPAFGCPFCQSSTAEKVRAGIFNSDFVYHLGVLFAPFPIWIAILILIYFWPARRPPYLEIEQLRRDLHISKSEHV